MSRIAHFTDVHVTADPRAIAWRDLASKRLVGWANLRFCGRHRALVDAPRVIEALLRDLDAERPDHILFTGDVTGLSLPAEFETARRLFEPLIDDARVTGIPGNHDVYVREAARARLFERHFGAWERTELDADALPDALRASQPYPLLRFVGDDVAIVCLRDVRPVALHDSSGEVPAAQLEALRHILALEAVRERVQILALHYGLRRADGSPDTRLHGLRNAEAVIAAARDGNVDLVVHGHLHDRIVHPRGAVAPFAVADPGALAYRGKPMAYHIYTVSGRRLDLEARRFDGDAGAFVPWEQRSLEAAGGPAAR